MKILLKFNLKKNVCEHEGQIFLTYFMLFIPLKNTLKKLPNHMHTTIYQTHYLQDKIIVFETGIN
jgi:hypothetical protein